MCSAVAEAAVLEVREELEVEPFDPALCNVLDPLGAHARAEAAAGQAQVAHGTPLTSLLLAIQAFLACPTHELTQYELGEHLISLRHGIDLLEMGFATRAAVFADTNEYDLQGSTTAIDWIRHQCRMSGHAAARAVAAGDQLHRLPASAAALDAGEIGFAHFSLLAGVARALEGVPASGGVGAEPDADHGAPDDASGDAGVNSSEQTTSAGPAPAFDERVLLDLALQNSVGRFMHDCIHARHAKDAASVLEEHVSAAEYNRFDFTPCENGRRVAVRGIFDNVGAAAIRTAVVSLAKPTGYGDDRPRSRRFADALVEIANLALDRKTVGERRTHLQLTASVETVQGLEGSPGGELEFAGAVPAATVQRLACDARIRRILLGPASAVIDVGRSLRLPNQPTRDALRTRAGGCEWPRCDRSVAFTNAHHLVHWGHGGGTDLANLVLLCYRHHWLVHEGGWQLARDEDGLMLAIPPSRTHRSWIRPPS